MKLNMVLASLALASAILVAGCGEQKEKPAEAPATETKKAAADTYSGGKGDFSKATLAPNASRTCSSSRDRTP